MSALLHHGHHPRHSSASLSNSTTTSAFTFHLGESRRHVRNASTASPFASALEIWTKLRATSAMPAEALAECCDVARMKRRWQIRAAITSPMGSMQLVPPAAVFPIRKKTPKLTPTTRSLAVARLSSHLLQLDAASTALQWCAALARTRHQCRRSAPTKKVKVSSPAGHGCHRSRCARYSPTQAEACFSFYNLWQCDTCIVSHLCD